MKLTLILAMEMPPKVDGCPWVLKFSTARDGFTLNSLVRKLSDVTSPVLILIQVSKSIFGSTMFD